jgi:hypothetical protein
MRDKVTISAVLWLLISSRNYLKLVYQKQSSTEGSFTQACLSRVRGLCHSLGLGCACGCRVSWGCTCYTFVTAINVSLGGYAGGTFGPVTPCDTHYAVSGFGEAFARLFPNFLLPGLLFSITPPAN